MRVVEKRLRVSVDIMLTNDTVCEWVAAVDIHSEDVETLVVDDRIEKSPKGVQKE